MDGRRAWVAIGVVFAWLTLGVVLVATCGCYRVVRVPVKQSVLEVKITEMPGRATCYLSDVPEPPQLKELDPEHEDILRRTMVHWLEYNALVQWVRDLRYWKDDVEQCLHAITGSEP